MILELRTPRVDEKADGQSATSQVPQERIGSPELPREITKAYRENESLAVKEDRAKETLRITIPPREISIPTERDFDSHRESLVFLQFRFQVGRGVGRDSVRGVGRGYREGDLGGDLGGGFGRGIWEGSREGKSGGEVGSREVGRGSWEGESGVGSREGGVGRDRVSAGRLRLRVRWISITIMNKIHNQNH
ncbi:hypothetical protein H6P81_017395 [Aristolochia fimbriata]|uniref:Uncharacterized protein n=1 Tax=Aristolochia fimbriata TaxID=158543 RepID=A0AAV7E142_ARIFI|nr:hypothetical protein H6P81_017395 [Aristolochia fimbriata]